FVNIVSSRFQLRSGFFAGGGVGKRPDPVTARVDHLFEAVEFELICQLNPGNDIVINFFGQLTSLCQRLKFPVSRRNPRYSADGSWYGFSGQSCGKALQPAAQASFAAQASGNRPGSGRNT